MSDPIHEHDLDRPGHRHEPAIVYRTGGWSVRVNNTCGLCGLFIDNRDAAVSSSICIASG